MSQSVLTLCLLQTEMAGEEELSLLLSNISGPVENIELSLDEIHQILSLQSVGPGVRWWWYSCLDISLYFSLRSMISEASTIFGPEKEQVLSEKMRTIVESFRSRARTVKQRIEQPPTPTGSC